MIAYTNTKKCSTWTMKSIESRKKMIACRFNWGRKNLGFSFSSLFLSWCLPSSHLLFLKFRIFFGPGTWKEKIYLIWITRSWWCWRKPLKMELQLSKPNRSLWLNTYIQYYFINDYVSKISLFSFLLWQMEFVRMMRKHV